MIKRSFFTAAILVSIAISGCGVTPAPEPEAMVVVLPTAANTAVPTHTVTAVPTPTATSSPPATATPIPTAAAGADGKVYLGTAVLLNIQTEASNCFDDIPAEIIYSPDKAHFLVIPACIEGDNHLFLFRADGTGKQQITGAWDWLNFHNVEWADDGQSFTYERINSCCLSPEDIPADAPPPGLVRVDIATGKKTLIAASTP